MKKHLLICIISIAALVPVMAQNNGKQHDKPHRDITELVSDLSASQKRKVEAIGNESKERVGRLRQQKKAVSDSIAMYMEREGDQSRILYPLFEREAMLQVAISKEMYATKCQIDEVLTPQQRAELRRACEQERAKHKNKKH